jgi:hypothetical protein
MRKCIALKGLEVNSLERDEKRRMGIKKSGASG